MDVPGVLLLPYISFPRLAATESSSGSYQVGALSDLGVIGSAIGAVVKLRMLFPLMLLLRLFVRACRGLLERRELWRFGVTTKGSAPGMASSVSPTREFGALAMKSGVEGLCAKGGSVGNPFGEEFQVH